jgi:hypothetical protein
MKRNMGNADRIVRILIAAAIAVLSFLGVIRGTLNIVLVVIAVILLLTSLLGVCPLYFPFKISTNKKKQA